MKPQWFILVVVLLNQLESIVGGVIYCTYSRFIIGWQGWILVNQIRWGKNQPSDRIFVWIFGHFQVDWRDTPPSDRATALMYAAAAGHAARDPTDSKDFSRQLISVQRVWQKRSCNRFTQFTVECMNFCRCFPLPNHFCHGDSKDIAVALLKAQVGSEVWIGPM